MEIVKSDIGIGKSDIVQLIRKYLHFKAKFTSFLKKKLSKIKRRFENRPCENLF